MRRAFTLVELMVICTVLVVMAALITPNVISMKASRDHEEAYRAVLRLVQAGRETAIQSGHTYTLTLTNSGTTLELNRDEDAVVGRDGQTGVSSTLTTSTTNSASEVRLPRSLSNGEAGGANGSSPAVGGNDSTTDMAAATLPSGASVGNVVLGDKTSSTSEFTLHFYPDGRSEGGGIEISDNGATRSLQIDHQGYATMTEGILPATTENSWEAGTYEQRASG